MLLSLHTNKITKQIYTILMRVNIHIVFYHSDELKWWNLNLKNDRRCSGRYSHEPTLELTKKTTDEQRFFFSMKKMKQNKTKQNKAKTEHVMVERVMVERVKRMSRKRSNNPPSMHHRRPTSRAFLGSFLSGSLPPFLHLSNSFLLQIRTHTHTLLPRFYRHTHTCMRKYN